MEVLPCIFPTGHSQIASLITVVHAESGNGYDLLWRVMELAVPGVDPAIQASAPIWNGDDIFDFCLAFVLYFRLMAKKGLVHDEQTKSISFLQVIREPAYVDVITTLHAHIDTFQSPDLGYLPPHLCMIGLATQMHKNVRAQVRDIFPCVHRAMEYPSPSIQGYEPNQLSLMDGAKLVYTATTADLSAMTLSRGGSQEDSWSANMFRQGRSGEGPRDPAGRGRYAHPNRNRSTWDPNVVCAACK